MSIKRIIATISLLTLSASMLVSAPRRSSIPSLERLPQVPIDTISTEDPETKIIIYTNNTWRYYRPVLENKYQDHPAFTQHWDTTKLLAYKDVDNSKIPSIIELNLAEDLSGFHVPIEGSVLSKYGWRRRRMHKGVDIPLKVGTPIYATFDGRVRYAQYNYGGYGRLVILRHANGLETWSGHLSRINVKVGEYVKAGQVIGFGGNTGRSTGPHLHYEIRYCDQTFDPEYLIDFTNGDLRYLTFALEKSFLNTSSRASELLDEEDGLEMPEINLAGGDDVSKDILEAVDEYVKEDEAEKRAVYHIVRSGDMLGKLAAKYKVSIDQICRLNGIKRTTTLRLGRRLRIK